MSLKSFFSTLGSALNIFDSDRPMLYSSNPEEKTVLSELGNVIQGAWSDYTGNTANRENIAYQQDYNEEVFKRADTQYQRTVADLRAAGLSSQLAAGAPSTVAGQSAAPQRSVGNLSEAMAKLVGMVTSLKQTNASAQLASAQAEKAKSEAALNNAQLPWVDKLNDSQYVTAMANKDYTIAMTRLKMLEGDNYTEKVQADIKKSLSEVNKNNKLVDLYDEEIKLTSAQEGKTQAERREINQRIENLKQQEQNLKQEFDNMVLQGTKIKADTANVLQQAATAAWNLMKSQAWNLRTNDTQSQINLFGIHKNNLQSMFDPGVSEVPQEYLDLVDSWYK